MKIVFSLFLIFYPFISSSNLTEKEKRSVILLALDDLMKFYPQAFSYAELNHMLLTGKLNLDVVTLEQNPLAKQALLDKIEKMPWVLSDE